MLLSRFFLIFELMEMKLVFVFMRFVDGRMILMCGMCLILGSEIHFFLMESGGMYVGGREGGS